MDIDLNALETVIYNNQDVEKIILNSDVIWEKVVYQPEWHTVWTGSLDCTVKVPLGTTQERTYSNMDGVKANLPTRVTGTQYNSTNTFTNVELGDDYTKVIDLHYMKKPTSDNRIQVKLGGRSIFTYTGITLTEIQQYY